MPEKEYLAYFDKVRKYDFCPSTVEGRFEKGECQFRATFYEKLGQDFIHRVMLKDYQYNKVRQEETARSAKEIAHQTFAGNDGVIFHQTTWLFPIETPVKETKPVAALSHTFDQKTRLFGMIKLMRSINIPEATKFLNLDVDQIKGLLFDLAGEGKISGDFKGDSFIITSDVNQFIDTLDQAFASWKEGKAAQGKI